MEGGVGRGSQTGSFRSELCACAKRLGQGSSDTCLAILALPPACFSISY